MPFFVPNPTTRPRAPERKKGWLTSCRIFQRAKVLQKGKVFPFLEDHAMDEGKKTYKQETKEITIRTSEGSTLTGKVFLGNEERVSDLFTKTDSPFIVLVDAEHRDGSGKVLIVNKGHIVWVEPED